MLVPYVNAIVIGHILNLLAIYLNESKFGIALALASYGCAYFHESYVAARGQYAFQAAPAIALRMIAIITTAAAFAVYLFT